MYVFAPEMVLVIGSCWQVGGHRAVAQRVKMAFQVQIRCVSHQIPSHRRQTEHNDMGSTYILYYM